MVSVNMNVLARARVEQCSQVSNACCCNSKQPRGMHRARNLDWWSKASQVPLPDNEESVRDVPMYYPTARKFIFSGFPPSAIYPNKEKFLIISGIVPK